MMTQAICIVHCFFSSLAKHAQQKLFHMMSEKNIRADFSVNDIDMDDDGQSDDRLASTGVDLCVGFVVISDYGQTSLLEIKATHFCLWKSI